MVVHVNLGQHSYDVVIEKGILKKVDEELNLNRKVLVVTDCGYSRNRAYPEGKQIGRGGFYFHRHRPPDCQPRQL